jgi:hypothetical protein
MIPAYAKPAHHRLRAKLAEIAAWNEAEGPIRMDRRRRKLWASSDRHQPPCMRARRPRRRAT